MSHPTWVRGLKPLCDTKYTKFGESHPTWVRGLKRGMFLDGFTFDQVAPYVGAWIETHSPRTAPCADGSHPTWVRGLKLQNGRHAHVRQTSHPTWVRGLKLLLICNFWRAESVAPYVGAWIETKHNCRPCR